MYQPNEDFEPDQRIPNGSILTYIRDINSINYFACSKKYCFYGSNDRRNVQRHEAACRDETKMDYRGNPAYSSMITKLCTYNRRSEFIIKVIEKELQERHRLCRQVSR